ncbi:MAG: VCBS repeat-containing protein [Ignavibacteriaceae bacterium]|nr:VCBS repeat-containing protein [Ignavibacteriaceae bacterium]
MKKHYNDEKQGLLKRKVINGSLILFMLYQSGAAQIPINGFCKYSVFPVDGKFRQLFALNFNQDSYSDLLLTGGEKNSYANIAGKGIDNFAKVFSASLPNGKAGFSPVISNFISYIETFDKSPKYAFVSRKQKIAGWLNVSTLGSISVANQISFSSFPDVITPADLNADGKKELLISGVAFDGISILNNNNGKIEEKKLHRGTAFSQSVAIDLNSDSYPDIAAFNINNNSLQFFYNNSRGEFKLIRTIELQHPIASLQAFDFNSDYYADLLFISGNELQIIFGDSVSGYQRTEIIKTNLKPDKFVWGDFNRDGKFDIAYLSTGGGLQSSQVSVLFQKNDGAFYPEIPYLQKRGLIDVIPFYSKFVYGFASLSSDASADSGKAGGNIYFVSNLSSYGDTSDLVFGNMPSSISLFDNGKDGISDLCLYNADKGLCSFVLRGKDGLPSTLFSQKINGAYSSLLIDDNDESQKGIYFFNIDERVIEYLLIDFNSLSVKRDYLYVDGGIKDCRLMKSAAGTRANIVVVHTLDDKLFYSSFTYKNFRYSLATASLKTGKLLDAKIDAHGDIYFWTKGKGEAELSYASFKNPVVVKSIHSVQYDSLFQFRNYLADVYSTGEEFIFTAVSNNQSNYLFIGNSRFYKVLWQPSIAKTFLSDETRMNYFGKFSGDRVKRFFLYSSSSNNFLVAGVNKRTGFFNLQKISDIQNVGSFAVDKFSANRWYLLYTNTKENCLSFKKL